MNLFSKATTKKEKNEITKIEVSDENFFDKVKEYETLSKSLKTNKAKVDLIGEQLKNIATKKWLEEYKFRKQNPNSIILFQENEFGEIGQFMFIPSDRYVTINPKKVNEIIETYGESIIEEKITHTFNNDMIEKYGDLISNFIKESEDIDEEDKDNLIISTKTISISKGTIDNFTDYGDVEELFEITKPVISLKDVVVLKS